MDKKTVKRTKPEQVKLLNGCYRSQFKVHPSNWDQPGAKLNTQWYFSYRFYDPTFFDHPKYKKGRQRIIKGGVNEYQTLMERRQLMKDLLSLEKMELDVKGFNPITNQYMATVEATGEVIEYEVHPDTPFSTAINKAFEIAEVTKEVRTDIKSVLKFVLQASEQLRYDNIPVKDFKRSHAALILKSIGKIKGEDLWTNNNFNYHRKWFRKLFSVLVESGTMEDNPVDKIQTKVVVKKIREVLTDEQRLAISTYLQEIDYYFWRFLNIFYGAGSRTKEIMLVQAKNVDLDNQKFKAVIKKGDTYREVLYTISDSSLKYWVEALSEVEHPDDYVFAKDLRPGAVAINSKQVTRRWRKWIKGRLSDERAKNGLSRITADWYSLKHLRTTAMVTSLGVKAAAEFNKETEKMINTVYDVLHEERKHEAKKKINTPFVPILR